MPNDEITLSEAKKITSELKASILKLDALNQDVVNNINLLQDLNSKLENYASTLHKFDFKDETEMTINYASYLSFLSKKIDELSKNSYLKRLEKIVDKIDYIINLSVLKVTIIVAVITTALNFIIIK